ncbi:hypothetical protein BC936DRAFT_139251 [Jimgerdemannia flammicorona]|uniref:AMP-dependent synthetase/ligase domain-containing protein n=1 Tax=Jimgerdemannia flammicorona TaxID=994334 RepID=A0A433BAA4_9FUNG|nr:hypothetical protein BC936DRAFT_139251 [Jimgerdemannia flammicorona]
MDLDTLSFILLGSIGAVAYLSLNNSKTPDVHPLILNGQADVSRIRNAGESAIYRCKYTPNGQPLFSCPDRSARTLYDIFQQGGLKNNAQANFLGTRANGGKGAYEWVCSCRGWWLYALCCRGRALVPFCWAVIGNILLTYLHFFSLFSSKLMWTSPPTIHPLPHLDQVAKRVNNFGSGLLNIAGLKTKSDEVVGIFAPNSAGIIRNRRVRYVPMSPPRAHTVSNLNLDLLGSLTPLCFFHFHLSAAHHYSLVTVPLDQHDTVSTLTHVLNLTGMTVMVVSSRTLPAALAAASEASSRALRHVIVIGTDEDLRADDRRAAEIAGIELRSFEVVEKAGESAPVENVAPGKWVLARIGGWEVLVKWPCENVVLDLGIIRSASHGSSREYDFPRASPR